MSNRKGSIWIFVGEGYEKPRGYRDFCLLKSWSPIIRKESFLDTDCSILSFYKISSTLRFYIARSEAKFRNKLSERNSDFCWKNYIYDFMKTKTREGEEIPRQSGKSQVVLEWTWHSNSIWGKKENWKTRFYIFDRFLNKEKELRRNLIRKFE